MQGQRGRPTCLSGRESLLGALARGLDATWRTGGDAKKKKDGFRLAVQDFTKPPQTVVAARARDGECLSLATLWI